MDKTQLMPIGTAFRDPGAIRALDPARLSPSVRALLERSGLRAVSRNSRCPCGSFKRFKNCCLFKEG